MQKIEDADELRVHLIKNKFYWLKNGQHSLGTFEFHEDGTLTKSFNDDGGVWKTLSSTTLWFKNYFAEFVVEFNDVGTEGVLISPERNPPSKMIIKFGDDTI